MAYKKLQHDTLLAAKQFCNWLICNWRCARAAALHRTQNVEHSEPLMLLYHLLLPKMAGC
jgi:hypothetical protein